MRSAELEAEAVSCATPKFEVSADFSGAAMADCRVLGPTIIEVIIRPEDADINPSPWYAVEVTPVEDVPLTLEIAYQGGKHRYQPKIRTASGDWSTIEQSRVSTSSDEVRTTIELPAFQQSFVVSGQEIVDNASYSAWLTPYVSQNVLQSRLIGRSVEGRQIRLFESRAETDARRTVLLVGRQHPPEVTGALAIRGFVDAVLSDTDLATAFRRRFDVVLVPNMNPDGVEHGHWRHNMNGVDLNRDWGPFSQPETQTVKSAIDRIDEEDNNDLVLFLDFHSTHRNLFYTQLEDEEPTVYDFTGQWLQNARARLPNYAFEHAERDSRGERPTSKNYMFQRFDIPSITYELGDETDRALIAKSSRVFAEEMMRLLLEHEAD